MTNVHIHYTSEFIGETDIGVYDVSIEFPTGWKAHILFTDDYQTALAAADELTSSTLIDHTNQH